MHNAFGGAEDARFSAVLSRMAYGVSWFALAAVAFPTHVDAQNAQVTPAVIDLPRPGYEPGRVSVGQTIVEPTLSARVLSNDNVFASEVNKESDTILTVSPALNVRRATPDFSFSGSLFGEVKQHSNYDTENGEVYGADASLRKDFDNAFSASLAGGYVSTYELRQDPEASTDFTRAPTGVDQMRAEARLQYKPGRLGLSAFVSADQSDYSSVVESDRDLTTAVAAVRGIASLSHRVELFVEGFANQADFDQAVDRNGVNRDSVTKGVNVGTRIVVDDKWSSELAAGYFDVEPDDPVLESFSGLGVRGNVSWRPRRRTSVVAEVFRGDVATVRSGASGRIDTRGKVTVTQEVRHNILAEISAGVRDTSYQGGSTREQTQYDASLRVDILLNRHVALTFDAAIAERTANFVDDEFSRNLFGVGLTLRY